MTDTLPSRVLVIDDNTSIHDDFRKILDPRHAAVASYDQAADALFRRTPKIKEGSLLRLDVAKQGQEGLACVKRALQEGHPYAMAFVDMRMPPGWDGLETITRIWQVQPELLVVICTAFSDYSWEEINERLGQSDRLLILKKPFDNVEVRQFVHALVARSCVERNLHATQRQLLDASRQAGMAEIATSVLHNVGNVLNSVNVSATIVCDRIAKSSLPLLRKSVELLRQHRDDLSAFLTVDPKGLALPGFLEKLAGRLESENAEVRGEMETVARNVEHIKEIVSAQQSYGNTSGSIETFDPRVLIEDALRLNGESLGRHDILIERDFTGGRMVTADRHKVIQILVNLLRNAKQSIVEASPARRRITLRLADSTSGRIAITVEDTGVGISAENFVKIFQHGFTTKKNGHGFGLHASILSAREMNGDLIARSDGPGCGASFTLELPGKLEHESKAA